MPVHYTYIYWNIVYWRDFLPMPTGSTVCIWRNIFKFAYFSIYNLYDSMQLPYDFLGSGLQSLNYIFHSNSLIMYFIHTYVFILNSTVSGSSISSIGAISNSANIQNRKLVRWIFIYEHEVES